MTLSNLGTGTAIDAALPRSSDFANKSNENFAIRRNRSDRTVPHRGGAQAGLQPVGLYARCDPKDSFDLRAYSVLMLFKLIARKGVDDLRATAELVRDSGLDWTLVRIPNLKDGPASGTIDLGWYGKSKLSMKLSRSNLAKFLVKQVSNREFVRAAPAIANH
ncbi:NAD(P)H-binding protein [Bradyrhizobium sp. CCBAU 51745]|uniref:NAD(P)H-binding protein n=1 Tax=Bradyrhizobium sp. CCBAU 51745 TaxID=1325099 RepID=UPI0023063AA2|nr:NAD(P)H-binding protein [Bradyrhizobium sp. CCBAU 51745]